MVAQGQMMPTYYNEPCNSCTLDKCMAKAKEMIAAVMGGEGTVSSTTQTPEKTDVYTPTTDPDAAVSVPETPADSMIVEVPVESVPEQPAEQPTEQPAETPAEQPAATETPQPETTAPAEGGSTETPAVSLPTQEQVEQAAGSLYSAASTVLDAILGASGN